jgi:hypothetical protein
VITIEYYYNALIERLNANVALTSLIGMDALVHRAKYLYLRFNLAIVAARGVKADNLTAEVQVVLTNWLSQKSFKDNVQIADMIEEVGTIPGVDNVRLIKSAEKSNEVQRMTRTATGGQYKIRLPNGEVTGNLAHDASAATIQAALEATASVLPGDIVVSNTGSVRDFTFTGDRWGNRDIDPLIAINGSTPLSGGGQTFSETTKGLGWGIQIVEEDGFTMDNAKVKTTDFYLESDTLPVLFDVAIRAKAQNTF